MGGAPDHDDAPELSDDASDPDLAVVPADEPVEFDAERDAERDADEPVEFDAERDADEPVERDADRDADEPVEFDAGGDLVTRVANAKRRHGAAGGMLAAGMLGIDQMVSGRKPREEAPIVVAANSEPVDIDTDGILVSVAGADVIAPPLPRTAPKTPSKRRRR